MSGRSEEEREEGKEVGREGNGGGGWGEVVASNPLYDGGVISLLCGKQISNIIVNHFLSQFPLIPHVRRNVSRQIYLKIRKVSVPSIPNI